MRALSQILSDESLSYSLKHISTGSTHFTFHGRALISYIYISCFHDDVIKWKHVPRRWGGGGGGGGGGGVCLCIMEGMASNLPHCTTLITIP